MNLAPQEPKEILLQHVSARLQKSLKSLEAIIKFGVTVLHQLPYIPDLAPSHFHLLGALKDVINSVKPNNDVIHAVRTWLCEYEKTWYQPGIHTFVPCWHKTTEMD